MDQCMYNPDCVAWMYYINTENQCAPDPQTGLVPEYDSDTGLGCRGKVRAPGSRGGAAHARRIARACLAVRQLPWLQRAACLEMRTWAGCRSPCFRPGAHASLP